MRTSSEGPLTRVDACLPWSARPRKKSHVSACYGPSGGAGGRTLATAAVVALPVTAVHPPPDPVPALRPAHAPTEGRPRVPSPGAQVTAAGWACTRCCSRDSAFSFHTLPSSKNSLFHIGTVDFNSSMAQLVACTQAPPQRSSNGPPACLPASPPGRMQLPHSQTTVRSPLCHAGQHPPQPPGRSSQAAPGRLRLAASHLPVPPLPPL